MRHKSVPGTDGPGEVWRRFSSGAGRPHAFYQSHPSRWQTMNKDTNDKCRQSNSASLCSRAPAPLPTVPVQPLSCSELPGSQQSPWDKATWLLSTTMKTSPVQGRPLYLGSPRRGSALRLPVALWRLWASVHLLLDTSPLHIKTRKWEPTEAHRGAFLKDRFTGDGLAQEPITA